MALVIGTVSSTAIVVVERAPGRPELVGAWPRETKILEGIARLEPWVTLRWPYLVIRLENARAVYRVSTLEGGKWAAELLEGARW